MAAVPRLSTGIGFLLAPLLLAMQFGSGDLSISRVALPDGSIWMQDASGSGRKLGLDVFLKNNTGRTFDVWDPKNSEGSICPSLVLTAQDGHKVTLRPLGFERSGVPSVEHLAAGETLRVSLNLADLRPDGPLNPGVYQAEVFYRNARADAGPYHGVWTGEIHSIAFELRVVRRAQ
jgi:hypothetical protein